MIRFITMKDLTSTHLAEVKKAFETYATDYFSSVVLSEDRLTLDCYDGDSKILSFNMTAEMKNFKILFYGNDCSATTTIAGGNTSKASLYRIYLTSNGIAISFKINNTFKPSGLLISKSNSDNTCIVISEKLITGSTTGSYGFVYTKNSSSLIDVPYITNSNSSKSYDMTSIVPTICSGIDEYCPYIFAVLQSQYCGTEGTLTIDGINYWYNGAFALKDE